MVLLQNAQHILLLMVPLQILLLALEGLVAMVLTRHWEFVRRAYFHAVVDCWPLRRHIRAQRSKVRRFRVRSDWQMLRFFKLRINRWDEVLRVLRFGMPKVG
jgi:hypothetical protein